MARRPPILRERIDAEAARELLTQSHQPDEPERCTERDAKLFWLIQQRIIGGGAAASHLAPEEAKRWSDRADLLCQNHEALYSGAQIGTPAALAAMNIRERILDEIQREAIAELREIERQVATGERESLWGTPNAKR